MNIAGLFPIPIGICKLPRLLTEDEINFVLEQETTNNDSNISSKDNRILNHPRLNDIKTFCQESTDKFYKDIYAPKLDNWLTITQSWANYTHPGQFHHRHNHPNSFISGVMYIQANKNTDKIIFYNPEYEQLRQLTDEYNIYNSESWFFEVESGMLILFPSKLWHMVPTVDSMSNLRVSVAFNTFPLGILGSDIDLREVVRTA